MRVEQLGEAAYIVRDLPCAAYTVADWLNTHPPAGLVEAVASYESLGLYVEPEVFDIDRFDLTELPVNENEPAGRLVEIPCRYDGPDLTEVARLLSLTEAEVIHLHSSQEYTCYAIGFCPGFPYLGYVPDALVLPRKDQPLQKVPAGSVAIAGRQTGVYPLERPGGWWLLGSTEMKLVDLAEGYFALKAGDRVRFRAA